MIKEITTDEFKEKYLQIAEEEYSRLNGGNHVEFDSHSMISMMELCEGNRQLCIFIDEIDGKPAGCMVGMLIPSYMNLSHWAAYNMVWFVLKEYRKTKSSLRLLKAYEGWAESMGCRDIHLGVGTEGRNDMKKCFKRYGYKSYQTTYIKRLF